MRSSRLTLVSADGHAGPPLIGYRPYLESRYHEEFDRYAARSLSLDVQKAMLAGDLEQIARHVESGMSYLGMARDEAKRCGREFAAPSHCQFDSAARTRRVEGDGIAAEVLYPDSTLMNHAPFSDTRRPTGGRDFNFELRIAGVRAYNRWLADFCNAEPGRRAGVIMLPPPEDIDSCVAEIHAANDEGLFGGVEVPGLISGGPGFHDSSFDPIWAAAAERGLPIAVHAGVLRPDNARALYGDEPFSALALASTDSHAVDKRPLWFFILGGIFERFPDLRLIFAEQLCTWIPGYLDTMERLFDIYFMTELKGRLEFRPREYWERNCRVGASFMSRSEAGQRDEIGVSTLMWGSDFPHVEGTWPYTSVLLAETFSDVPAPERERILAGNALEIYGFDADRVHAAAARIGPPSESLDVRPDELPSDYKGLGVW